MKTLKELKDIDFSKLSTIISKELGYFVEFSRTIDTETHKIVVTSNELKEHTGIMKDQYTSFILASFGTGINDDEDSFWMPLHFTFAYKNGGSNGQAFKTCWYMCDTKEWIIK